ncbi:MAG: hypothetical protein V4628_09215 [Pseudomonadota bacterium]
MKIKMETTASPIFSNVSQTLGRGLILLLCLPLISFGQTSEDYSHLIFEPAAVPQIPLAPADVDEASAPTVPLILMPPSASTPDDVNEQPANAALQNDIGRYERELNTTLQEQDQYSAQLREQYAALGDLLQQNGEHERAISMFENAMQIDRVNNGLFTTLQIPLVKQIIESQGALGNLEEEADLQSYLYYINQKAFADDSEEFLAAKEAWADWNVQSYLEQGGNGLTSNYALYSMMNSASSVNDYVPIQNSVTGEYTYVPRSQLPWVLSPSGMGMRSATDLYMQSSPYAVMPEEIIDERLRTAEDLYEEILETRAAQNAEAAHTEVQHKLANIAYAVKRQMDALESELNSSSFSFGSIGDQPQPNMLVRRSYTKNLETLEAIAEELENSPDAQPTEKAMAYINIGDWNVLFERPQRAEEAYVKAWQTLRDAGIPVSEITALFLPQPLVPVPTYVTHEFSKEFYGDPADIALDYKGHIDTTVDVDRFGRVTNIRIDSESADTPRRVRDTLFTYLRENKMRPTVANGEVVKLSGVKVRYYYSY